MNYKRFHFLDIITIVGLSVVSLHPFTRLIQVGWSSADYGHAYFILPVSLFLIWLKRGEIRRSDEVNLPGVLLFLAGILTYLYSAINFFMFLEATSFVIMMLAVFRLRVTKESFKAILFPLCYLGFLIPPPSIVIDTVTFPLKQMALWGSYHMLKLFQIPVELYGVILKVGNHEMFIADACSGFRSITTLLSLGAVYIYFQDLSKHKKWILFVLIVPIGVAANIFRIFLTGVISLKWGADKAEGFFHEFSGVVLFVITTLILIGVTELFLRFGKGRQAQDSSQSPEVTGTNPSEVPGTYRPGRAAVRDIILSIIMVTAALVVVLNPIEKTAPGEKMNISSWIPKEMPAGSPKWKSLTYDTSDYSDEWQSINELMVRKYYMRDETNVDLFVEYSSDVRRNFSFHFPENCHRAGGNEIQFFDPLEVDLGNGQTLMAKLIFIKGLPGSIEKEDKLVAYWLVMDGKHYHKTFWIKADQMLAGLLKQSKSGFLVRVDFKEGLEYTDPSFENGKTIMSAFIRDLYDTLEPSAQDLLFGSASQ